MPKIESSTTGRTTTTWVDFSEEIDRGMAFLDDVQPGWASLVDPRLLDLANSQTCVLGQTFEAHYSGGCEALEAWAEEIETTTDPVEYGFCIGEPHSDDWEPVFALLEANSANDQPVWSALTEAWLSAIQPRVSVPA